MQAVAAPLPRLGTARNPERQTLGDYVGEIGADLGFEFYPWQTLLSDVSMELIKRTEPHGNQSTLRLNAQYVGALVGRQSGKTAWSVARVVAQSLLTNRQDIAERVGLPYLRSQHTAYTAQSRTVAVQKWDEHVAIIEDSAFSSHIKKVHRSNGKECVTFTNGSTYRPITPTRTGPRGLTLDLEIVDEALAHPLWLLGALRPTMAQRDSAELCLVAQFVVISNAGDDDSELLNRIQELGIESLANPESRRVWLEWSMNPDADPLAESTWRATMPTLGLPNGIDLDFMRTEAETLRLDQFMREYLCHRVPKSREQLIPTERWMDGYRTDIFIPADLALALDISPDRQRASLVAAGAQGTYLPLEVIDGREGLDWVLERTVEVSERACASVVIDAGGPAASLIPALEARRVDVIPIATREVTNAAAMFYDAVLAKRVCHMNDYRLNDAVTGASKRAIGDRWAFDRRGHVDISPLVAASFAVWAIETGQLQRATIY